MTFIGEEDVLDGNAGLPDCLDKLVAFRLQDPRIVGTLNDQKRFRDIAGVE